MLRIAILTFSCLLILGGFHANFGKLTISAPAYATTTGGDDDSDSSEQKNCQIFVENYPWHDTKTIEETI